MPIPVHHKDPFTLRDTFEWAALGGATANVLMQLSWKPIGYGVATSKVESGNVFLHPWKRLRTTLSYLAVAVLGTPEEKAMFRREVDEAHRYVHSEPGAAMKFNAFDPELQLWVAACLYQGLLLGYEMLYGPLDEVNANTVYAEAATLGTTLQVPAAKWPADREAFQKYWNDGLARTEIDDFTRAHLWRLVNLEMLPAWLRPPLVGMSRFFTAAFLPPTLREQMQMNWSDADQEKFVRMFRILGRWTKLQPRLIKEFPYNFLMWDIRRRIRAGRPLIGVVAPGPTQRGRGGCPV